MGLVSQVIADNKIEAFVYDLAKQIGEAAPLSNRYTKKFINRLTNNSSPLTQEELAESYDLCDSDDYAEGVRAFNSKDTPVFKGC